VIVAVLARAAIAGAVIEVADLAADAMIARAVSTPRSSSVSAV
jgi:hypothetical protein